MSKFLTNLFEWFSLFIIGIIIIGLIGTVALYCAGNADFVLGFIIGMITWGLIKTFKEKCED